jgi:RNA polymerase sigma-70 factor, ECF subfamily
MSSDLALTHERDAAASRLGELLRTHYSFAWRCVRRFGVAERDVDDVVQEVFVVVSAKLDRIELGKERAFVTGTAIKLAANRRRSQRRAPELRELDSEIDLQAAAQAPSAEDLLDQKRRRALLDRALDSLSLELRAPFVLSEVEGLSRSETAELLGLPEGTVATRVRSARKRFEAAVRELMRKGPLPTFPTGASETGAPETGASETGAPQTGAPDGAAEGRDAQGEDSGAGSRGSQLSPSASSARTSGTRLRFEGDARFENNKHRESARGSSLVTPIGKPSGRSVGDEGTGWGDEGVLTSRCAEG